MISSFDMGCRGKSCTPDHRGGGGVRLAEQGALAQVALKGDGVGRQRLRGVQLGEGHPTHDKRPSSLRSDQHLTDNLNILVFVDFSGFYHVFGGFEQKQGR